MKYNLEETILKMLSRKLGAFLIVCIAIAVITLNIPINILVEKLESILGIIAGIGGIYIYVQGSIDKEKERFKK